MFPRPELVRSSVCVLQVSHPLNLGIVIAMCCKNKKNTHHLSNLKTSSSLCTTQKPHLKTNVSVRRTALARAQRSLFPISCMPVHPAHAKILKAPTLYASAFCSLARLRCPHTTRSRQPIRVLRSQCSRQNPAAFTLRTLCVPSSRATCGVQKKVGHSCVKPYRRPAYYRTTCCETDVENERLATQQARPAQESLSVITSGETSRLRIESTDTSC